MMQTITRPEMLRIRASVIDRAISGLLGSQHVLYGSFRDGTWLPVLNKEGRYEIDGDVLARVGFLSEEDQEKYIKHRDETPGFVHIDLTEMEQSDFKKQFKDMNLIEQENEELLLSCLQSKLAKREVYIVTDSVMVQHAATMHAIPVDSRSASSPCFFKARNPTSFTLHGDLVNCIACRYWPRVANSWYERPRYWPAESLVREITKSVFHLVSKPSISGDPETEWRYSFSFAEYKLMDAITGPKLTTYMILKSLINETFKMKDRVVLKTYHLKTLFFWACERQPPDFWNKNQIARCVFIVLGTLIDAFNTGFMPHYFIPKTDLLADIPIKDLLETTEGLHQIKQGLKCSIKSQNPEIKAIAIMELAAVKVQYHLGVRQLEMIQKDPSSDLRFFALSLIRECSSYISDYAAVACYSAHMGFINKSQLWKIEETLSCCYSMFSACAERLNSVVNFANQPMMGETSLKKDQDVVNNKFNKHTELHGYDRATSDIEHPHGCYKQPHQGEFLHYPYAGLIVNLGLGIAELTINKKMEDLLNNIVRSQEGWSLDILTEFIKTIIPDFKWSSEEHLSVHQLSQEEVWKFDIPFKTLVQQKSNSSLSFDNCRGKCWQKKLHTSKEILFASNSVPKITLHEVCLNDRSFIYAEGQKLENLGMLLLFESREGIKMQCDTERMFCIH